MGEIIDLRRGLAAAASFTVIAALLAACSPGPSEPAPVFLRGAGPTAANKPPPSPARDNTIFTVRHGDTVIAIAHDYHVPLGALIAANQLRTPYLIHPGDQLLIPDGGVQVADYTRMAAAAPPAAASGPTPMQTAALPPRPAATQIAAATLPPQPAVQTPAIVPPAPHAVAAPVPIPTTPAPAPDVTALASRPAIPAQPVVPQTVTVTPQVVALASHPATPAQPVLAPLHLAPFPQAVAAAPVQPAAPAQIAAIAPQPSAAQPVIASPRSAMPPQTVAATPLAKPPTPAPTVLAAAPQPPTKTVADVTPLDPPVKQLAAVEPLPPAPAAAPPAAPATSNGPPSVLAQRNPAAALPLPGESSPPITPGTTSSGRFMWPVYGRVLASYGSPAGGPHNEGINIAAPLGTPVRTIDAGTVAYVGNEVKGYGNLVLVKHANGWISAYANLDDIGVKKGDAVAAGEVIAKVGNAGNVGEPQLHFELRRGKKPVDPQEFLERAGSAAARAAQKAG